MQEITINESAYYKTTNLGIYIKHSGLFFPKSYPSKIKKEKAYSDNWHIKAICDHLEACEKFFKDKSLPWPIYPNGEPLEKF